VSVTVGLREFLVLSAVLFALGIYGALSKKSAIMILMAIELMTNAVNIALIAMSRFLTPALMTGQFFAAFIMVVSAAEIGLGLALVLALYKRTRTVEVDRIEKLKG
jgi:NADH:ubiquinone oxidoreductase subunit K